MDLKTSIGFQHLLAEELSEARWKLRAPKSMAS